MNNNQQFNQQFKLCKFCNSQIPIKAKKCAYCKKSQTNNTALWIILGVLGFFIIFGAIGSTLNENEESGNNENTSEQVANNKQVESNKETKAEENANSLTVGSTFEKKGLKITVNNADLEYTDYSDEYGLYALPNGMKYIMVSFTFENKGKSDAYVSIYDFDCYADNTSCEQAYLPDDNRFVNTNLSKGRNITFQTYYKVPVSAAKIELEYETSIWTGEKAVIKLK